MYQRGDVDNLPEYISCSHMARLLNLSRSRFYMLISPEEGIFLSPIYNIQTKRPYYTREMASINLECKRKNQGISGKVCMFYSARHSSSTRNTTTGNTKNKNRENGTTEHQQIQSDLESLGLKNILSSQIDKTIKECFPDGTDGVDEGEVVRQVFLSIKCSQPRT